MAVIPFLSITYVSVAVAEFYKTMAAPTDISKLPTQILDSPVFVFVDFCDILITPFIIVHYVTWTSIATRVFLRCGRQILLIGKTNAMRKVIPAPVIAVLSENMSDLETHASLDNLFSYAEAPGEPTRRLQIN
ncbi:MAG: hypothetical protein MZV65_02525 [Chromatiales bacterium]|nr:hypothetical protein [Chromatiales bacterium]